MNNQFLQEPKKPARNKLNYIVIEIQRDPKMNLPFVAMIGAQIYRFTLPGWLPWLLWVPIALFTIFVLFTKREMVNWIEPQLLRLMFWTTVAYFSLCHRNCLENCQTITQAAELTVCGYPTMNGGYA